MLKLLGSPRRCCDGITRRETLVAGALSALGGVGLPPLLAASPSAGRPTAANARRGSPAGKAKNVMMLFLLGGAAAQDMWDLKPEGPKETRGEFQPIATSAEGISICEHLPLSAKWMHKSALVRSLNHKAGCHNTLPCYTGHEIPLADITTTSDSYHPSMGSVCDYLRRQNHRGAGLPTPAYAYLPTYLGWGQGIVRPGPYAGFLGKQHDALTAECEPFKAVADPAPSPGYPATVYGAPRLPQSTLQPGITVDRLNTRRSLLQQLDDGLRAGDAALNGAVPGGMYRQHQERAFGILTDSPIRTAFDLDKEDPKLVDRYGRHLFGQSALVGRRLLERGVQFVNVTWDLYWSKYNIDYDAWDTHVNNFKILKQNKLPGFDQTFSALMSDLEGRGMLEETLVVVMSEMGRTPRINGNAGRDHWTYCYSALFAGAGIRGGTVHGASDAQAAYVKENPVSTTDICATIYHLLGISPETRVPDMFNRPFDIAHGGRPLYEILA